MTAPRSGRHCGARKRQGEGTCTRPAGWGTQHPGYGPCKLHGGSSRSVDGLVAEQQAQHVLANLGTAEPVANPLFELQRLAGECVAFRDALRGMVERLNSVRYGGDAGEQIRGEVLVYERALDRCGRILRDIAALRIDERLVEIQTRISERQGLLIAGVIRAVLEDLALTREQQARVPEVVPRRLRELAAGDRGAADRFEALATRRVTLSDIDRELELLRAERDALPAPEDYRRAGGDDD